MTTPNIEELIDRLYDWHNTSAEQNRLDMQKAADLLQSQAERIKELESEVEMWKATANAVVDFEKVQLRAEIAAIAATEPVLIVEKEPDYWSGGHFHEGSKPHIKPTKVWCLPVGTKLFTHPMPAQGVAELVEAFEYHIEQTRPIERSTIALSKYKGAK